MQIFLLIFLLICCTVRTSPVKRSTAPEVIANNGKNQDSLGIVHIVDGSSSSEDSSDRKWSDSSVMWDDSDWSVSGKEGQNIEDMDNNAKKETRSGAPATEEKINGKSDNSDKIETSSGKSHTDDTKTDVPVVENTTAEGVGIVVMDDKTDIGVQVISVDSDFDDSDDSNRISIFSDSDSSDSTDEKEKTFSDKSSSNQIDWDLI